MTKIIRIPKAFYIDHTVQRELPAPPILKETSRHYYIDADHPDASELRDDADFYTDVTQWADDNRYLFGLERSAIATVNAFRQIGA